MRQASTWPTKIHIYDRDHPTDAGQRESCVILDIVALQLV